MAASSKQRPHPKQSDREQRSSPQWHQLAQGVPRHAMGAFDEVPWVDAARDPHVVHTSEAVNVQPLLQPASALPRHPCNLLLGRAKMPFVVPVKAMALTVSTLMCGTMFTTYYFCVHNSECPALPKLPTISNTWEDPPGNFLSRVVVSIVALLMALLQPTLFLPAKGSSGATAW